MDNEVDILKIKIDRARAQLTEDTRQAIDAVPWKITILEMWVKKGYTFEQLGDLETETELLLCGLISPEDYPKELEKRMRITRAQANELVREMNELVFKKIKEEFIKITEQKKALSPSQIKESNQGTNLDKEEHKVLKLSGIEVLTDPVLDERELPAPEVHPELARKFTEPTKTETKKTEHTLENLTPTSAPLPPSAKEKPKVDPYREPIE